MIVSQYNISTGIANFPAHSSLSALLRTLRKKESPNSTFRLHTPANSCLHLLQYFCIVFLTKISHAECHYIQYGSEISIGSYTKRSSVLEWWMWYQPILTVLMSFFLVSVVVAPAVYIRVTGTSEFPVDWLCAAGYWQQIYSFPWNLGCMNGKHGLVCDKSRLKQEGA